MGGGSSGGPRVRVRVPSKVNLFLAVRGLRPDGYHELVTVLQTVSIHDTVLARLDGSVASAHPAARRFMDLAFTQEAGPDVPPGSDNLAVRAARQLMGLVGVGTAHRDGEAAVPVTRLHLTKRIPVAAGMAGGSADAAATLLALNHLWGTDLAREELRDLAAELGADVPFCVTGGTALATGTGTATAQVLCRGSYHWVVGISGEPLSTPSVYRAFDEVGTPSEAEPDAVLQALRTGDAEALGAALHNDLETAAFSLRPELRDARDAFLERGALGALVSGSGPTVVGLAESAQHATELAGRMQDAFDRVEVALSPAGGPEVAVD
ncbi:4-(cytidine 5'-diphospho)-2-C-methyl-D-erythritol kinase [Egicoccus sp. AB-alg6-2]|uniref:4-(cytidine 5'-diphospho)-2-C-methyl-D-erythritol kinase n=1 Tax=Egicoccus sp. AB-alg6-2 TaxID=3242692 RepID=UPI00359ED485